MVSQYYEWLTTSIFQIIEEAKRSLHDAMCVIRNLVKDNRIVYGGGSAETACAIAVAKAASKVVLAQTFCLECFSDSWR